MSEIKRTEIQQLLLIPLKERNKKLEDDIHALLLEYEMEVGVIPEIAVSNISVALKSGGYAVFPTISIKITI